MFGIRIANTPPEIHTGWVGNKLPSTNITNAWAGAHEVFGELWRSTRQEKNIDAPMSDVNVKNDTEGVSPAVATRKPGKDNDEMMSDTKGHKSTDKTSEKRTPKEGTNKKKVDKNTPATPTKRLISLKKILKCTGEGLPNT